MYNYCWHSLFSRTYDFFLEGGWSTGSLTIEDLLSLGVFITYTQNNRTPRRRSYVLFNIRLLFFVLTYSPFRTMPTKNFRKVARRREERKQSEHRTISLTISRDNILASLICRTLFLKFNH